MHNAKTDRNQKETVKALLFAGFTVQDLSKVGKGCPDLLVGFRGKNYLIEVKNGAKAKLTGPQPVWHAKWEGHVCVIHSLAELGIFMEQIK